MNKFKIGIVEDDMIIASAISEMLTAVGYEVPDNATHYSEAIELTARENPDLILLDINLIGKKDGIEVARTLISDFDIPFIFLTANLDPETLNRAKQVQPQAYLVKPITKDQLFSAIEIALSNYSLSKNKNKPDALANGNSKAINRSFFIKDGYVFKKIMLNEIIYLESDGNYVNIHLPGQKKIMVRSKLDELIAQMNSSEMLRIHRSYSVNKEMIDNVFTSEVSVAGTKLPIGKTYKSDLMKELGIKE
jgi:DNA-binding LytR/AlgR family response regulator